MTVATPLRGISSKYLGILRRFAKVIDRFVLADRYRYFRLGHLAANPCKMIFVVQQCVLALACVVFAGCAKRSAKKRDVPPSSFTLQLRGAESSFAASQLIRNANLLDCDAVRDALVGIEGHDWKSVVVRGLVEEILEQGQGKCAKNAYGVWPSGVATLLGQSLLTTDAEEALNALRRAPRSAVILRREAELLLWEGQITEGREILIGSLALEDDEQVRAQVVRLLRRSYALERALKLCSGSNMGFELGRERIATLAALKRGADVAQELTMAQVHHRAELAVAAVAASPDVFALAASDGAGSALLLAVSQSERVTDEERAKLLRRAIGLLDSDADLWSALAEAEEASGRLSAAIDAWDHAAGIALGADRPVLAPIRLLRESGNFLEARRRALRLTKQARDTKKSDSLHLAALAHRYAGDAAMAVVMEKEALARRPGDGRLRSELAHRLEEAGRKGEAATVLASLLACGSRGYPWHEHEIRARLATLVGSEHVQAVVGAVACTSQ